MIAAVVLALMSTAVQAAPPTETPKKEARTCRRVGNTGSRMDDKRICKTKSEWARIDAANNAHGVDADHTNADERNRGQE
ncbi:hypothetical protein ASE86_04840 [Sphingomonas sp. Leaf33]|uniref:hypothetical protein n=1 Tax=Sphingomonas sp. Leaf33 TaxID=1736215 RepID=UPI0006F73553|nr:hypothetical protein [Sphingomonas sp. Leaf33]KQN25555.1 hypothetical protein ASE86_04840 [Sphingomonas sp. Leaf33]